MSVQDHPRVALISTGDHHHLDEDLPLLTAALADLGIEAAVLDWHDPENDWSAWDLAVVRSPWDYTTQLPSFLSFLAGAAEATTVANPVEVIRWNADKRYLVELAAAGVPVVPTSVFEPGDEVTIPSGVACVVKPTVSAGARDTERYSADASTDAVGHASELLSAGRSVLVQPYVEGIDEVGETGLVYVGDRYSHAFRKGPILRPDSAFVDGLYREEQIDPREPSPAERAVAEQVLDAVATVLPGWSRSDLLYARVDLAPGPDGPLLMELELIEPSLFLDIDESSPARAAAAIAGALGR